MPEPRFELASFINKNASSSTDISDGLYSDLNNICKASGLGADIYFPKIPISKAALKLIAVKSNLKERVINGGDDYEILFTGPKGLDRKENITMIGKMTSGNKINFIDFNDSIKLDGYKHEI